jgi:hypothetical protein
MVTGASVTAAKVELEEILSTFTGVLSNKGTLRKEASNPSNGVHGGATGPVVTDGNIQSKSREHFRTKESRNFVINETPIVPDSVS